MRRYVNYHKKKRKAEILYEGREEKNKSYEMVVQLALFKNNDMIFNLRDYQKTGKYIGFLTMPGYSISVENFVKIFPHIVAAMECLKGSGYLEAIKKLRSRVQEIDVDFEDDANYD